PANLLRALAEQADRLPDWPAASLAALHSTGAWRWAVPAAHGGDELEGPELLRQYAWLASQCLTSAFILSQRDSACRRIRDHGSEALRQQLLPELATGQRFVTVGLSHLTTSRQHLAPSVRLRSRGDSWVMDGRLPWVTGAAQ